MRLPGRITPSLTGPGRALCAVAGVCACAISPVGAGADCVFDWTGVGGGIAGRVIVMLPVDAGTGMLAGESTGALYVGGLFTQAGGAAAANIARWDGSAWSTLATGVNAEVLSMALYDDGLGGGPALYVGGEFTMISGQPIRYIARWDGQAWSALAEGTNDHVLALAVYDDGLGAGPALYAGGFFPNAGDGFASHRIAKWDGVAWSPLGMGLNGFVRALAVYDDGMGAGERLIAAGQFTTAGGNPALRIASWDGDAWAPLGGGLDNVVYALSVYDSGSGPELYAAGAFANAGGNPAQRIARWNGAGWSAVGTGLNNDVTALATLSDVAPPAGSALYAGGLFTAAGVVSAAHVARWDGSAWGRIGSGVGPSFAYALASFDGGSGAQLHVGGDFSVTGAGAPAKGIAAAELVGAIGDANGDLLVNFEDITTILSYWGSAYPGGTGPGDANGDGAVNMADLTSTISHWLEDCSLDR